MSVKKIFMLQFGGLKITTHYNNRDFYFSTKILFGKTVPTFAAATSGVSVFYWDAMRQRAKL